MALIIDRPISKKTHAPSTKLLDAKANIERILITPDIAMAFLDKNLSNRKIKRRHVDSMAQDMAKGRFPFTGDAIRFSSDGRLIDGQHRLLACIKADKPFETLVIYGLDPDVQAKVDTNVVRSVADTLVLGGFHNATTLASAARSLISERDHGSLKWIAVSKSEVVEFVERHKELPSVANAVRCKALPKGVAAGHLTAIIYVGKYLMDMPDVADSFYDVMATGIPAYKYCAAHAFRERMLRNAGSMTAFSRDKAWILAKHAWNAFSAQEPVKNLRMPNEAKINGLKYDLL